MNSSHHLMVGLLLSVCSLASNAACRCIVEFTIAHSPGGEDHMVIIPVTADGDPTTDLGRSMLATLSDYARAHPGASIEVKPAAVAARDVAPMGLVSRSAARLTAQSLTAAAKTARGRLAPGR